MLAYVIAAYKRTGIESLDKRNGAGCTDWRTLPDLQEPALGKRNQRVLRDHNVIENTNVHQSESTFQGGREQLVGARWFGNAARVAVRKYHRCTIVGQGTLHDFPRIHRRLGECSAKKLLARQETILGVELCGAPHNAGLMCSAC